MRLRPIGQDERLSIIDHLDELRSRILISLAALLVAFGLCFWQNHALLNLLNNALPSAAKSGLGHQEKLDAQLARDLQSASVALGALSRYLRDSPGVKPGASVAARGAAQALGRVAKEYPRSASPKEKPVVLGPAEGFTVTVVIAGYFALLLTLPLLIYQVYAFVLPALNREERRVATPTVIAAPLLFAAVAAFTYFAILPPAIHFLQGYNSSEFQVLIQAGSYYRFEILLMMGIGLAFQVPLLALGLQRVGVISSQTLTLNWRYASVIIAVIVAALPGVDPVTMTMELLPLAGLYILSIVLLKWVEYRDARAARAAAKTTDVPPVADGPSSAG